MIATDQILYWDLDEARALQCPEGLSSTPEAMNLTQGTLDSLGYNPFNRKGNKETVEILGVYEGKIVGKNGKFPTSIILDGEEYAASSGTDFFVLPEYRKFGVGIDILEAVLKDTENGVGVYGGVSALAQPLLKYFKTKFVYIPQMRMVHRSGFLLKRHFGGKLQFLAPVVDFGLNMYRKCGLGLVGQRRIRGFRIEQVSEVPAEVDEIVAADKHPYRENHNHQWLNWNLNHSFSTHPLSKQEFYLVYRGDELLGFFMLKIRHNESICDGKYKDVMRGKLIEWGTKDEAVLPEFLLFIYALQALGSRVDISIIETNNQADRKKLKYCGMLSGFTGVVGIYVSKKSPLRRYEHIDDTSYWRLRPASGDTGLN